MPNASRGRRLWREITDPILLPMPSPTRNTARMMENV